MKKNKYNIAIIGSGWYGCHIASFLQEKGVDIKIFDKSDSFFSGASGFNQNRLHLGYHYPRCSKTRYFSKNGFKKFKKKYPNFSEKIDKNYYCIHQSKSLLDFETYKTIMKSEDLKFRTIYNDNLFKLKNIEGVISCDEELINTKKAKKFFQKKLEPFFQGNYEVNEGNINQLLNEFDWVIDCTWGGYKNYLPEKIYYEACLTMIYESSLKERVGLTVMDGELFSLYPMEDNFYTLTSVKELPLSLHRSQKEASAACNIFIKDKKAVGRKIELFENEINSVFPDFKKYFTFSYPQTSIKTKFKSSADTRIVKHFVNENLISIFAGKIDTVFDAEQIILKEILYE